jgi:hypothetical protein
VIVLILKILESLPNEFAGVAYLAEGQFLNVGRILNKGKICRFDV